MEKNEIVLSIGDVSRFLNTPTHTLRYWEKEFAEYLSPSRTEGKQRRYSDRDMESIREIKKMLKEDGYSIAGAKKLLSIRTQQKSELEIRGPAQPAGYSTEAASQIVNLVKNHLLEANAVSMAG
jgi:DNA-binding transcriptional MerR regulator